MRSLAIDIAAGAAAFAVCAAVLLLQNVSMPAVEYGVIVLPAIFFPLAALIRPRRTAAFVVIALWCIAAFAGLAWIANSPWTSMAIPALVCIVSVAIVEFANRSVAAVAIAVFCGIAAFATPAVWGSMLTRRVDFAAPNIVLRTSQSTASLTQMRGNVVVLNFWGVWCGPCVRELPELDAVANSGGAKFFAVNSSIGGETVAQIAAFVRARNVTVPVAFD
ncbi:MAG TPA: TlpA disulfide reductase family protein, partial [Thermoanaerobaculia bacterium]|nr:TlpA disulfide reductase family protein [Thermoanaerobaculia bacterium]